MTIYYPPGTGGDLLATSVPGTSLWNAGNAECGDRFVFISETAFASGVAQFCYFNAPAANTITKLGASTGATTAAGLTLARVALFTASSDDSLTKVAQIAPQTHTTFGPSAYGDWSFVLATAGGFPASYTFIPGQRYALGVVQVGTTPAGLRLVTSVNGTAAPVLVRTKSGQTDLAASYAVGALTADYQAPYMFGLNS